MLHTAHIYIVKLRENSEHYRKLKPTKISNKYKKLKIANFIHDTYFKIIVSIQFKVDNTTSPPRVKNDFVHQS